MTKRQEIVREIRYLLEDGQLDKAIYLIQEQFINNESPSSKDKFIPVLHSYSRIEEDYNFGRIKYDEYLTEQNKIVFALLKLFELILESDDERFTHKEITDYKSMIADSKIKELLDDLIKKTTGTRFENDALMISFRFSALEKSFFSDRDLEEKLDGIKSDINALNKKMEEIRKNKPRGILGLIMKIFFD